MGLAKQTCAIALFQQTQRAVLLWQVIHDRDAKFTAVFDEHFRRDDGGAVHTP